MILPADQPPALLGHALDMTDNLEALRNRRGRHRVDFLCLDADLVSLLPRTLLPNIIHLRCATTR